MPITVDEVVESAAKGVLRALEARGQSLKVSSVPELVRSGFQVEFIIRAGGRLAAELNPQPLPPGPPERGISQE